MTVTIKPTTAQTWPLNLKKLEVDMSYYHNGAKTRTYISKESYLDYLQSPEWKARADKRREIDRGMCQLCGIETENLEVHHLNYFSLKKENPYTDLVCLCPRCHEAVHRMMCRITSPDGRRGWADLPYTAQKGRA